MGWMDGRKKDGWQDRSVFLWMEVRIQVQVLILACGFYGVAGWRLLDLAQVWPGWVYR